MRPTREMYEREIAELEDFALYLFDNAERIAYEGCDTNMDKEKRMYDICVEEEKA